MHTLEENKANRLGRPIENRIFPEGNDVTARQPRPYNDLRWSVFTNRSPQEMYEILDQHVFPFLRQLGADGSSYARNMKDARFTIPTAELLVKVVDLLNDIPMKDRDTKGDIYEYMLSKLATSGTNGQFRTSRHIIKLMVDMTAPTPDDTIIDPAAGTAGFLVAAGEYLHDHHGEIFTDAALREHYNQKAFTGYDSDASMARIGSMNLLLHGVENPTMERADSLAESHPRTDAYTLVLANPPFAGSLDYETTAKDLLQVVKTKKTELLFLALMIRVLKYGGRAAVIVPDGVLFGSSKAHKELRRMLVEDHKLEAVVKLPSGTFKPYTGVSTAILFFTKTSSGGTDNVWFYDVQADGFSLDDKRTPLDPAIHEQNNLPDVLARWQTLPRPGATPLAASPEAARPRTAQSFLVPKAEIAAQGYDLSLNRYKEVEHEHVEHRSPADILDDLAALDAEIAAGLAELRRSLSPSA
ncbi:HsdM family class I SAM-dependent methyltransferase [Glaciibacter superstes]|uniref:HsdM family class I SAM-dependent methyltransferase n=1 Tax=Glaciibacter superstes TaxID=501023 RepID=UPI00041EE88B|nr:class I SAM-dependent DNA methyltransferase [Glaciibacter superstes]